MGPPKHPLSYVVLLEMCLRPKHHQKKQMSQTPPICMPEISCSTEGLRSIWLLENFNFTFKQLRLTAVFIT